jgi:hypothetical protein
MNNLPKDCCPICGYQYEDLEKELDNWQCIDCGHWIHKDELITEEDDYAWCW